MNQKKERWGSVLYMLVTLSIPTIIEEVLATLIQYVDTAMVGQLGEQATASVSVSTTVTWLVNSVPHAIGIGVLALIAKAVGSGDKNLVRRISSQAVWMVIGCSIVLGGISLLLSPYIPIWMGAEASIQGAAGEYFFIISLPMLFRVSSIVFGAAIRATKRHEDSHAHQPGCEYYQCSAELCTDLWCRYGSERRCHCICHFLCIVRYYDVCGIPQE